MPSPLPPQVRAWVVQRWKPLAAAGGVVVLLFLNELFITPPLFSPRVSVIPEIAGRWEGRSSVTSTWCRTGRLRLALVVAPDGIVSGTVGDAALDSSLLSTNRSWLGAMLGWRSAYILLGNLSGPIVSPEGITREEVHMPLSLKGTRLVGCLKATGGGNDGNGDLQTTGLSMFKPGPECSVTFRVKPERTPEASRVYITGDNDQFGNWDPAGAALDRQDDGTWARQFHFPRGMVILYNCTRGSWRTQALDPQGNALANRTLVVYSDTTITIPVGTWADVIN